MLAQAPDVSQGVADAASAVEVTSVWDFVVKGGPMMIPIALGSLIALTVIIERFISLRRKKVIPPSFLPELKQKLNGHPSDAGPAVNFCRRNGSPVANVFAAGLKRLGGPLEIVERHIQEAGQREVLKLRRYLRVLSVVAAVSPLMGLLGTIFGMIGAFQTVAMSADALGRTEMLAEGIYEAMITTAAGLVVAIPTLIFYHWLSSKVQRLVMDIDEMTVEFLEDLSEGRLEAAAAPDWSAAEARRADDDALPADVVAAT
jgi:biopolymer transport protein ExbB